MPRRLLALLFFIACPPACVSEPCVGDACPNACNGLDCSDLTADVSGTSGGRFTPCVASSSCDQESGFSCVDGTCRHPCLSHFDCGGIGVCEPLGTQGNFCSLTLPDAEAGGYYTHCPSEQCDSAAGFLCIGKGPGDTESYCTQHCEDDSPCPTGFQCDTTRDAANVAQKVCVPSGFCSECESDGDCLSVPNGICAKDASGAMTCTVVCDLARSSCPWGTATDCKLTDDRVGQPTCQHRSGACRAEGKGCDPCARDADCGEGNACVNGFYSGERWCVDRHVPCTCEGLGTDQAFCQGESTGCPLGPEGIPMACYDQVPLGAGVCYGVNLPSLAELSCWR